jgi:hypothetical protein
VDNLLVTFDRISMTSLDILNHVNLSDIKNFTEGYKTLFNLVNVENKKLGIDELCVNEEAYKIHIQNECC